MIDLLPKNAIFGVSGIGPAQLPASIQSVLLGGHARTGLEDNPYYAQGDLATNQRLTEGLVRDMGYEPATPAEARDMPGLSETGIRDPLSRRGPCAGSALSLHRRLSMLTRRHLISTASAAVGSALAG